MANHIIVVVIIVKYYVYKIATVNQPKAILFSFLMRHIYCRMAILFVFKKLFYCYNIITFQCRVIYFISHT